MIGRAIQAKNVDRNAKKWKRPSKSSKNKMFVFGLHSTFDDRPSNPSKKCWPKCKKNKKGPLSHWKIKCLFLDYIQLLMIGRAIWAKNVDQNAKKWKRPPKSLKNKMFIFGLCSTFDDRPRNPSKKCWPKCKKNEKGPLSHRKIKCSFLDYIQLLMIGWAIRAKNVDRNTKTWKRPPKSLKNQMFIFGLHSTSDDRPSDLNKNVDQNTKKWKRPPKSSKNFWIMFNFWWSAEQSGQKMLTEMWKNEKGPLSHWKIKCSFLDYIQLLMIGQAIQAKNVDRNAKKIKKAP